MSWLSKYERRFGVYELYDESHKCLYVGQSLNLARRLRQHQRNYGTEIYGYIVNDMTELPVFGGMNAGEVMACVAYEEKRLIALRRPRDNASIAEYDLDWLHALPLEYQRAVMNKTIWSLVAA